VPQSERGVNIDRGWRRMELSVAGEEANQGNFIRRGRGLLLYVPSWGIHRLDSAKSLTAAETKCLQKFPLFR
jgi:hypothetical protein